MAMVQMDCRRPVDSPRDYPNTESIQTCTSMVFHGARGNIRAAGVNIK